MKLALGTAQFGLEYGIGNREGRVLFDEASSIVRQARAGGMDVLDTAMGYGDSERRLGGIGVGAWRVVSKLPALPDDASDPQAWVAAAVRQSLRRLSVSRLYGLLLHRPAQLLGPHGSELFTALQQLKADGLVEKIGVSIYEPAELDALCAAFQFDLVQAPFNVLDRRLIGTRWLARLSSQGTELHVRSVFLQGLLLMPAAERPPSFDRWATLWTRYDRWLRDAGLTPLQACLRYASSFAEISKVIVGVDNVAQLADILRAADGPAPVVPGAMGTDDADLLNPARWSAPRGS